MLDDFERSNLEQALRDALNLADRVTNILGYNDNLKLQCDNQRSNIEPSFLGNTIISYYSAKAKNNFEAVKSIIEEEKGLPPKYSDGSFRTRNNGLLEYRFIYKDRTISVYGRTEDICFDKRTAILEGKVQSVKGKEQSFGQWLKDWFKLYKFKNGEKSKATMLSYINRDIIPALGKYPLNRLQGETLQSFINQFSDRPNSQKKIALIINGALKKAVTLRKIKYNPFEDYELVAHTPQSYRCLSFEEQNTVLDNISEQYRPLFIFACLTGIRIGRILELDVSAIDKENCEITVLKKQKNGLARTYIVQYHPMLFEQYCPLPKSGKLFNLTYNAVSHYFQRLYKKLGIKKANVHSFRHTFVSLLGYAEVRPKSAQDWAGHTLMEMTMNIYTHSLKRGSSILLDYIYLLKQMTH